MKAGVLAAAKPCDVQLDVLSQYPLSAFLLLCKFQASCNAFSMGIEFKVCT